jgi:hypothetical protein
VIDDHQDGRAVGESSSVPVIPEITSHGRPNGAEPANHGSVGYAERFDREHGVE